MELVESVLRILIFIAPTLPGVSTVLLFGPGCLILVSRYSAPQSGQSGPRLRPREWLEPLASPVPGTPSAFGTGIRPGRTWGHVRLDEETGRRFKLPHDVREDHLSGRVAPVGEAFPEHEGKLGNGTSRRLPVARRHGVDWELGTRGREALFKCDGRRLRTGRKRLPKIRRSPETHQYVVICHCL